MAVRGNFGSTLPYRPNVGAMVLNQEGKIWVGHRNKTANNAYGGPKLLWQMTQGGVDDGEELEAAARRELYEETGIASVELIDRTQDWLSYDFPPDAPDLKKGRWAGQKQMWFVFRFVGDESEVRINPPPDGHEAEFDDWRWEEIDKLPELIVPFKRPVYECLVKQFSHHAAATKA